MRILVMGGTGEVGHHVANGLAERGHEVTVLGRGLDQRGFSLDDRIQRVQADKTDPEAFERVAVPAGPEVIVDTVPRDPTVRAVHALFAGKIRHYIHCGSTGVYAPLQYFPGDEEHPWAPKPGDFFASCAERDELAMGFFEKDGFPVTILRPTMIIGPGVLPVDSLGARGVWFLEDLAANRPIELAEDGDALVQAGLNADLAQAFVLAAEKPDRAIGEIFNISCKRPVTLRQYIELFREAVGSTSPIVPTPIETIVQNHAGDGRADEYWLRFLASHMFFDLAKARERLGYDPPSDMRNSIRLVVDWSRKTGKI
jgi:nucleoside-diphosphate-sugar epimerase